MEVFGVIVVILIHVDRFMGNGNMHCASNSLSTADSLLTPCMGGSVTTMCVPTADRVKCVKASL